MDKLEIKQLLIQIKVFYPRFEAVEKDGSRYGVMTQTVDAWHRQIGYMELDQALGILDGYLNSADGGKVPNISLWTRGGKVQKNIARCTAKLEASRGVIRWEPEAGTVFERKIKKEYGGVYEDEDGYIWAMPEGN